MSTPYDRSARPWDIFNRNLGKVQTVVAEERLSICRECPELGTVLSQDQCKQCNCIMPMKVKLPNAFCPLGHWEAVRISYLEEQV